MKITVYVLTILAAAPTVVCADGSAAQRRQKRCVAVVLPLMSGRPRTSTIAR
jgi:hypothetical protein